MIIIQIQTHNRYGIGQKAFMADHIDWPAIMKTMIKDFEAEEAKYFITVVDTEANKDKIVDFDTETNSKFKPLVISTEWLLSGSFINL